LNSLPCDSIDLNNIYHRYHIFNEIKNNCIENKDKLSIFKEIINEYNLLLTLEKKI